MLPLTIAALVLGAIALWQAQLRMSAAVEELSTVQWARLEKKLAIIGLSYSPMAFAVTAYFLLRGSPQLPMAMAICFAVLSAISLAVAVWRGFVFKAVVGDLSIVGTYRRGALLQAVGVALLFGAAALFAAN